MFILQCILGLHSQIIDFTHDFSQADIPSGEIVFIEIPRDFIIYEGQGNIVISLKKSLYGQSEAARLWNKIFTKWFVISIFLGEQGGYLHVHV